MNSYCHHSYTMNGHTHPLHSLYSRQLSPDPILSLSAFRQSYYPLKSFVQRLKLETRLREHEGCVNCINFSTSGEMLASGSDDLHVVLWDWARGRMMAKYDTGHVANVFQAKFMPHTSDSVLVTAARDGQIRCMVVSSSGSLITSKRVAHHNDSAHKVAVEPDSPHIFLSCGEDGSVLEVDLRDEPRRNKILVCKNEKNSRIPLYSIFIDPSDSNCFAISGRDQFARVYDRRMLLDDGSATPEPLKKFCPHHLQSPESDFKRANITCLVYSHNGKELLCSYNDEDIYLFDASHSSGSEYVRRYRGHRNNATVKGVNFFGLRSEYVVSGSDCGHVFLWDKETEEIVQCLEGDNEGVVNCLEPHPHIPVLATSGLDHDVKVFSPSAERPTVLEGLAETIKKNSQDREEALEHTTDGYELFMQFILRQYRRGIRHQIGIPDEDSDSSDDGQDDDDDLNLPDYSDDDEERPRRVRCVPS